MERAVQMNASFLMHGDPVGTSFRKCGNELIRILNHQVTIEGSVWKCLAERSDNRRADGDVRHKVPIHHVKMQNCAAACERSLRVGAQLRKVGRQYRGCQFNDGSHRSAPPACTNSDYTREAPSLSEIGYICGLAIRGGHRAGNTHAFIGTETVRRSLLLWRANSSRRITSSAHSGVTASAALPRIAPRKLA